MTTFDHDALWTKSKLFVDKALRARDADDDREFYLWASISLELLAKAALAHVHPALVVDPSHFPSLLAACHGYAPVNAKSIPAKTVYDRLTSIVDGFDDRTARECQSLASRRNAELHSGDAPTIGLDVRVWVPAFWRAADLLCRGQAYDLDAWLGEEEGDRVRAILSDTAEVAKQAVYARIARRRNEFQARYPSRSREFAELQRQDAARSVPPRYIHWADAFEEAQCPACTLKGWLFGSEQHEEILEEASYEGYEEGYPPEELVRTTYGVDYFRCVECNLSIDGYEEIEIAGLPEEFSREEYREATFEEDYGNE